MRQKIQEYKFMFFVSMLIGIVCHGFMIFNKFSLNDDNDCLFRLGVTFPQGRWALGVLDILVQKLGTYNFGLPAFNGVWMVLCLSISACLICEIFEIKHEEDVAFLNRLATRIQSFDGYNDDYPVFFYNIEQVHDNSFFKHPQLAGYTYLSYNNQVNNMYIYWYLNNWIGFGPQMATESDKVQITSSTEFAEMTVYPDDGSIRIINDIIVVKCTE